VRTVGVTGTWCVTCGDYIRPGTHGVHEMRYGQGALRAREPEVVSDAAAVLIVLLKIVGAAVGAAAAEALTAFLHSLAAG
jgi:hypothetical protein